MDARLNKPKPAELECKEHSIPIDNQEFEDIPLRTQDSDPANLSETSTPIVAMASVTRKHSKALINEIHCAY